MVPQLVCSLVALDAAEVGVGAGGGDHLSGVSPPGETPAGEAPSDGVTPGEACSSRSDSTVPAGVSTPKSITEV